MNTKGVTPIVAVALLVGMVVATSGMAFIWIITTQNKLENTAGEYVSSRLDSIDFIINDITCNSTTSNISITLYNSGRDNITIKDTWIFLQNLSNNRTTINYSAGPPTTVAVDKTVITWPNNKVGMTNNVNYGVRIAVASEEKEVECTGVL